MKVAVNLPIRYQNESIPITPEYSFFIPQKIIENIAHGLQIMIDTTNKQYKCRNFAWEIEYNKNFSNVSQYFIIQTIFVLNKGYRDIGK